MSSLPKTRDSSMEASFEENQEEYVENKVNKILNSESAKIERNWVLNILINGIYESLLFVKRCWKSFCDGICQTFLFTLAIYLGKHLARLLMLFLGKTPKTDPITMDAPKI